jgi:hypothetical protein
MKTNLFIFLLAFAVFYSCEFIAPKKDPPKPDVPDLAELQKIADSIANDTVPHEVMYGKYGDYAYMPDTLVAKLVLANPVSFDTLWRASGANMIQKENKFFIAHYLNMKATELMTVYLYVNENKKHIPYAIVVQKYYDYIGMFPKKYKPEVISEYNFVTGHSIYIGMSSDYVKHVYSGQKMMQWSNGDTLYLQYKPAAKDQSHYHRYSFSDYTATYKFVGDKLRVMEYSVDPKTVE